MDNKCVNGLTVASTTCFCSIAGLLNANPDLEASDGIDDFLEVPSTHVSGLEPSYLC